MLHVFLSQQTPAHQELLPTSKQMAEGNGEVQKNQLNPTIYPIQKPGTIIIN